MIWETVYLSIFTKEHFETCVETASGEIETSLWNTLSERGVNPAIIDKMEDALASSVDFYHTQKEISSKSFWEKYIDGQEIGMGKIDWSLL